MTQNVCKKSRQLVALLLALVLGVGTATTSAGVLVRESEGVVFTGADGVRYETGSGVVFTGADRLLGFGVNNISWADLNGVVFTGADGTTFTGIDGATYTGTNTYRAERADGVTFTGADGVTFTGADGIVFTGADGTTYRATSVILREPNGIIFTGADGVLFTGADGVRQTAEDGVVFTGADGGTMKKVDSIHLDGARQLVATGTDGRIFYAAPDGVTFMGADGVIFTGADGVGLRGVDGVVFTGADGLLMSEANVAGHDLGLRSFDPELAMQLDKATDDSNINAVVVYNRPVTDADINYLKAIGVQGGTRYRVLPMVTISANREQIEVISKIAPVRSVWGNRTLQWTADASRALTGATRVGTDADLTRRNNGTALTGRGVTVALLDTGLDSTHGDIAGRVARNVKLADFQGVNPLGFTYPTNVEGLPNTDLLSGHGTFVGGIIAGNGAASGGKYKGVAPGARLVGLSAGDVNLFYVLTGFDYLLEHAAELNVRAVNCSFSANAVYDPHDPVNVATKMLTEYGINVVFSAGNTGDGLNSLNPYAAAPWVVSVGATDARSRPAAFSSRGVFGSATVRPTLVAPGVDVVSLRSVGSPNLTGLSGLASGVDAQQLSTLELPYYTTGSGTSFSAPQVVGTIALMLEAAPGLTPAEVRDILQRTATPLPPYYAHEVGAGLLNAHAAVLEAAFRERHIGMWRATTDQGQVQFRQEPAQEFSGTVTPSAPHEMSLTVPPDALLASVQIGWGPVLSVNDLALSVTAPNGVRQPTKNAINLPGLTGRRERASLTTPAAGAWRIRVSNTLGLVGTPQSYSGLFEVARVEYATLPDIDGLNAASRSEIRQALRSFVMFPSGGLFRPADAVTRAELAATLVRGARVPQYVPGQPSFTDVSDALTLNYVESAQAAPGGALFPDAKPGDAFRPDAFADRATAAVVLVRAAGLRGEAENFNPLNAPLLLDTGNVPAEYRNYVYVAVTRGLLAPDGSYFRPQAALTRAELAHALATIAKRATQ